MKTATEFVSDAERQACLQMESIADMVAALNVKDEALRCEAEETIQQDPLSLLVRSSWGEVGGPVNTCDGEFELLLCTGGPAVRLIGELEDSKPSSVMLQYQDWGTPWTEMVLTENEQKTVFAYLDCFWFGE